MATVYLTEAELAKDLHSALEKVQHGVEIVIAQNERPVAVLKASRPEGRMISEVVADLKARGCDVVMEDDFAKDIEEGVRANRHPWNPPSWD